MNGNDLIYDEMNVLLQKENAELLQQLFDLTKEVQELKKKIDTLIQISL